ncbi:hypothetical protein BC833DRAFT_593564 [Globomyces pollinis-pini]|nr:hypothetical protein BC833DRAFT_593564 [Globomyces pollinis-pini]
MDWTDEYRINKFNALTDLINFVLKAAGCSVSITADSMDDPDSITDTLEDLQARIDTSTQSDYPLITKNARNLSRFRKNLMDFWSVFIQTIKSSILFEDGSLCINTIINWLVTMTSSAYRPIRHTSTLSALALLTALCEYSQSTNTEWVKLNQQLTTETNKGSATRQKQLASRVEQLHTAKVKLEALLGDVYNGVFVHRYRDADPNIRSDCIKEMGTWIIKCPDTFLDPSYLRYLGWMLSDKVSTVRLDSLHSMLKILTKDFDSGIRLFCERFKQRVIDMALGEKDHTVRLTAVKVVCGFNDLGFLDDSDQLQVVPLILDHDAKVRDQMGLFVCEWLDTEYHQSMIEKSNTIPIESSTAQPPEYLQLKSLAQMLVFITTLTGKRAQIVTQNRIKSHLEQFNPSVHSLTIENSDDSNTQLSYILDWVNRDSALLVDTNIGYTAIEAAILALLPHLDFLKQFDTICKYLLHDFSTPDLELYKLSDEEETCLLFTLTSLFTYTFTKLSKSKKVVDVTLFENGQRCMTTHLLALLKKYASEFSGLPLQRLNELVILIRTFDLSYYVELRLNSAFHELVDMLLDMFSKHTSPQFLTEITTTLFHLCGKNASLASIPNENLQILHEYTMKKVEDWTQSRFEMLMTLVGEQTNEIRVFETDSDLNELTKLGSQLTRLYSLSQQFEFKSFDVFNASFNAIMAFCLETSLQVLKSNLDQSYPLSQPFILNATVLIQSTINLMLIQIISDINGVVVDAGSVNMDVVKDQCDQLVKFSTTVLTDLEGLIFQTRFTLPIQLSCIQVLNDLFPLLNGAVSKSVPVLGILPDPTFHQFAQLALEKCVHLLVYVYPRMENHIEVSSDSMEVFYQQLFLSYYRLSRLVASHLLDPVPLANTIKYYGVDPLILESWALRDLTVEVYPRTFSIIDANWTDVGDFVFENVLDGLSVSINDIYTTDWDSDIKIRKVEHQINQIGSFLGQLIKNSMDLYLRSELPSLDSTLLLTQNIVKHCQKWIKVFSNTAFLDESETNNIPTSEFLNHIHSSISNMFLNFLHSLMIHISHRIVQWNIVFEKSNDMDISFQTTYPVLDVDDNPWLNALCLVGTLKDLNVCWNVVGLIGSFISKLIDHFPVDIDNSSSDLKSVSDIFVAVEMYMNKLEMKPIEDDEVWKSFFQAIEEIKSGVSVSRIKKPRTVKSVKSKVKKSKPKEIKVQKVPVQSERRKSSRLSISNRKVYVEGDTDSEDEEMVFDDISEKSHVNENSSPPESPLSSIANVDSEQSNVSPPPSPLSSIANTPTQATSKRGNIEKLNEDESEPHSPSSSIAKTPTQSTSKRGRSDNDEIPEFQPSPEMPIKRTKMDV